MTTPSTVEDVIYVRKSAETAITRMLIAEYGYADQFIPGFFRVGMLGEGEKEGVYCIKLNALVLNIEYDEIIKGSIDTECVVRIGERWGIYSLKDREFVYPFDRGARQIRALPEVQISVSSTVRSLYVVLTELRWSIYNTVNGLTTTIA